MLSGMSLISNFTVLEWIGAVVADEKNTIIVLLFLRVKFLFFCFSWFPAYIANYSSLVTRLHIYVPFKSDVFIWDVFYFFMATRHFCCFFVSSSCLQVERAQALSEAAGLEDKCKFQVWCGVVCTLCLRDVCLMLMLLPDDIAGGAGGGGQSALSLVFRSSLFLHRINTKGEWCVRLVTQYCTDIVQYMACPFLWVCNFALALLRLVVSSTMYHITTHLHELYRNDLRFT